MLLALALTGCIEVSSPQSVNAVSVIVPTSSLRKGEQVQAVGIPVSSSGSVLSGKHLTWESSNTAIMTVTASGLVTGLAVGSAEIKASVDGQIGRVVMVVIQ